MTAETMKGAQLRGALAKYREQQPYGKFTQALRDRAVAYCGERSRAGATVVEIADELGVHEATATKWVSTGGKARSARSSSTMAVPAAGLSLVPVVVRPEPPTASRLTRLEVEFPDGTRLAALGVGGRDLVEAIESLRRGR